MDTYKIPSAKARGERILIYYFAFAIVAATLFRMYAKPSLMFFRWRLSPATDEKVHLFFMILFALIVAVLRIVNYAREQVFVTYKRPGTYPPDLPFL
jgi:hypothetical protein